MAEKTITVASSHIPQVAAGKYRINVKSENEILTASSSVDFIVSGFIIQIPQTEILSVYPPKEGQGNYAGTFPMVQFRRSSLPWDFEVSTDGERIPYLFLALFEEDELDQESGSADSTKVTIKSGNTSDLDPVYEKDKEFTYLTIPEKSMCFLPEINELRHLAHVRIQEDQNTDISFESQTSVVLSKRMAFPEKKYRAFICSYLMRSGNTFRLSGEKTDLLMVLYQWQFKTFASNAYQFNDLKFNGFYKENTTRKRISENPVLHGEDELFSFLTKNKSRFGNILKEMNSGDQKRNEILSLLKYEGKTLKGLLHELVFSEIGYNKNLPGDKWIKDLIDLGKVPLLHHLKSGGKVVSWYQGPFVRSGHRVIFKEFSSNPEEGIDFGENIPNHPEKLMFYSKDTNMLDLGYAAAWQLGRLLVMNNVKVVQEIKKWKHQLRLNELILSQNQEYSPINLSVDNSVRQLPEIIRNFIINTVKFVNFPYYYLFPDETMLPEGSIRYFKLDNAWVLSMLFGMLSIGNDFTIRDFKRYVLHNSSVGDVFDYKKDYNGFVVHSEIISNWPQLQVEFDNSSQFQYITDLTSMVRLYMINGSFSTLSLFMKNENAHFAIDFPNQNSVKDKNGLLSFKQENEEITYTVSGFEKNIYKNRMPFDLLFRQPKVVFTVS
ncbi:hypothetical protein [Chryseobacterium profundimaris]|uniref:Uncharacterized protein n=1 Tax=Chryseobacterium profundimaris TaxID=1387275 RepID=A0ABY1NQ21_9FLAO|nr:hypothetical protein [Chryseobacterium profundimaris]SMP15309.1 hypothetical protein SAMN06264346_103130 [Chryseobacterium profundimaris]